MSVIRAQIVDSSDPDSSSLSLDPFEVTGGVQVLDSSQIYKDSQYLVALGGWTNLGNTKKACIQIFDPLNSEQTSLHQLFIKEVGIPYALSINRVSKIEFAEQKSTPISSNSSPKLKLVLILTDDDQEELKIAVLSFETITGDPEIQSFKRLVIEPGYYITPIQIVRFIDGDTTKVALGFDISDSTHSGISNNKFLLIDLGDQETIHFKLMSFSLDYSCLFQGASYTSDNHFMTYGISQMEGEKSQIFAIYRENGAFIQYSLFLPQAQGFEDQSNDLQINAAFLEQKAFYGIFTVETVNSEQLQQSQVYIFSKFQIQDMSEQVILRKFILEQETFTIKSVSQPESATSVDKKLHLIAINADQENNSSEIFYIEISNLQDQSTNQAIKMFKVGQINSLFVQFSWQHTNGDPVILDQVTLKKFLLVGESKSPYQATSNYMSSISFLPLKDTQCTSLGKEHTEFTQVNHLQFFSLGEILPDTYGLNYPVIVEEVASQDNSSDYLDVSLQDFSLNQPLKLLQNNESMFMKQPDQISCFKISGELMTGNPQTLMTSTFYQMQSHIEKQCEEESLIMSDKSFFSSQFTVKEILEENKEDLVNLVTLSEQDILDQHLQLKIVTQTSQFPINIDICAFEKGQFDAYEKLQFEVEYIKYSESNWDEIDSIPIFNLKNKQGNTDGLTELFPGQVTHPFMIIEGTSDSGQNTYSVAFQLDSNLIEDYSQYVGSYLFQFSLNILDIENYAKSDPVQVDIKENKQETQIIENTIIDPDLTNSETATDCASSDTLSVQYESVATKTLFESQIFTGVQIPLQQFYHSSDPNCQLSIFVATDITDLSDPQIVTFSNSYASIKDGTKLFVFSESSSDADSVRTYQIQYVPIGLENDYSNALGSQIIEVKFVLDASLDTLMDSFEVQSNERPYFVQPIQDEYIKNLPKKSIFVDMDSSEHTWTLNLGTMSDYENDEFEVEFLNYGSTFVTAKVESDDAILVVDLLKIPQSGTINVAFKVTETILKTGKIFTRVTLISTKLTVFQEMELEEQAEEEILESAAANITLLATSEEISSSESQLNVDNSRFFTESTFQVNQDDKPIEIQPVVKGVDAAGVIKMNFEPPVVRVPSNWSKWFDGSQGLVMKTEKSENQAQVSLEDIIQVRYIKNSDEIPQKSFSIKILEFSSEEFKISLEFSDPLLVSQGQEADIVNVFLLKSFFLQADSTLTDIRYRKLSRGPEDYYQFDVPLPRLVTSKEDFQAISNTLEKAEQAVLTQFIISFILQFLLKNALSMMWNIFNTMQILMALKLSGALFPGNVFQVHSVVDKSVNMQIIPKEWLYDNLIVPIFGTQTSQQKLLASQQEIDQSVESIEGEINKDDPDRFKGTNLVMNMLLVFLALFFVLCLIALVIFCRIKLVPKMPQTLRNLIFSIENKLMWNSVLRAILQIYLLYCISIQISFNLFFTQSETNSNLNSVQDKKEKEVNMLLTFVSLIGLIYFPIFCGKFLQKNFNQLVRPKFKAKYGSLYQNVDYYKRNALWFTSLFCVRRFLVALVLIQLKFSIVLQVFCIDIISTGILIFYMTQLPMENLATNIVQIFNELVVLFCTWYLFLFTNYVPEATLRYYFGSIFLTIIAMDVIINVLVLLYQILSQIVKALRKKYIMKKKLSVEKKIGSSKTYKIKVKSSEQKYQDSQIRSNDSVIIEVDFRNDEIQNLTKVDEMQGHSDQKLTDISKIRQISQDKSIENDSWNEGPLIELPEKREQTHVINMLSKSDDQGEEEKEQTNSIAQSQLYLKEDSFGPLEQIEIEKVEIDETQLNHAKQDARDRFKLVESKLLIWGQIDSKEQTAALEANNLVVGKIGQKVNKDIPDMNMFQN